MSYIDMKVQVLGYRSYSHYLISEHWQLMKRRHQRSRCFTCGYTRDLHLHHITYNRLGRERKEDLVTLCQDCHRKVHKMIADGETLSRAHRNLEKHTSKVHAAAEYPNQRYKIEMDIEVRAAEIRWGLN